MSFEFSESVTLVLPDIKKQMQSFAESNDYRENNKLITEIAAIHAGLTSNFNMYTAEALEGSLNSWVAPYARPIIMNHDELSEPVGRVMKSTMAQEEDGTRYVLLQAAITDPIAVEKILDGRYLTGSVGGKAESAKCSVCDKDWAKESLENGYPCRHKRGQVYEGKLAYFELGELTFKEYSFVNIPADQHSGVRSLSTDGSSSEEEDSKWQHSVKMFAMSMDRPFISEMTESAGSTNVLERLKKKEATATYMSLKGSFLSVAALDYLEKADENGEIDNSSNTITNEFDPNSDELILSQLDEEPRKENAMPGTKVTTTEAEDDVLAVAEQLSADLAADDAGSAEESEETEESEESEELSESSDEETDPETTDEEVAPESDKEEEEEQLEDSEENVEQADESDSVTDEGVEGQEDGEVEPKPETEADEVEESADKAEVARLVEENAKLRGALKRMLAERVVDAKIARGIEESANRANLVEEHSGRTASSLADALRDVERYAPRATEAKAPEMEVRSGAIGSEESVVTDGETIVEEKAPVNPLTLAESIMTDVFMNRKKL